MCTFYFLLLLLFFVRSFCTCECRVFTVYAHRNMAIQQTARHSEFISTLTQKYSHFIRSLFFFLHTQKERRINMCYIQWRARSLIHKSILASVLLLYVADIDVCIIYTSYMLNILWCYATSISRFYIVYSSKLYTSSLPHLYIYTYSTHTHCIRCLFLFYILVVPKYIIILFVSLLVVPRSNSYVC